MPLAVRSSRARPGSSSSTSGRSDSTRPGASAPPTSPIRQRRSLSVSDLLPGGADHVFDFVGLKAVAEQGLAMLGTGGGLYLVGVARPDVEISLNIVSAIDRQMRVQGVNLGS